MVVCRGVPGCAQPALFPGLVTGQKPAIFEGLLPYGLLWSGRLLLIALILAFLQAATWDDGSGFCVVSFWHPCGQWSLSCYSTVCSPQKAVGIMVCGR